MNLPTIPKFEKSLHHVVPVFWQRRFASPGDPGPYYKNILSGAMLNAQGPGKKMAEEYANIVFDEFFRPSDDLEDQLSKLETKFVTGLDALINDGEISEASRIDIAMLIAVQACRYPELFASRLDIGKYLAITLIDFQSCPNVQALNQAISSTGILPGAQLTEEEFTRLQSAPNQTLESELEAILNAHGYEKLFNPDLILSAAIPLAEHLLALHWQLLHSPSRGFILSDRPVPYQLWYGFSIGLSAAYGLVLSKPGQPVKTGAILPTSATQTEVDAVNTEVKSRAQEWICGPGNWVHYL